MPRGAAFSLALALLAGALAQPAPAQELQTGKPIRLIVALSAAAAPTSQHG
jgi:hypothetical protein